MNNFFLLIDEENLLKQYDILVEEMRKQKKQIIQKGFAEAYACKVGYVNKFDQLAQRLARPYQQGRVTQKILARIIFAWIAQNISYAVKEYINGTYHKLDCTVNGVLRQRKSVCEGYANLFVALSKACGLQARKVSGFARSATWERPQSFEIVKFQENRKNSGNHAWVIITIKGKEFLVDPCWGAGYVSGEKFVQQYKPEYFMANPETFFFSHYPVTDYRDALLGFTRFQDLRRWFQRPYVRQNFQYCGLQFIKPYGQYRYDSNCTEIKFGHTKTNQFTATLISKNGTSYSNNVRIRYPQKGLLVFQVKYPKKGRYAVLIFSNILAERHSYEEVMRIFTLCTKPNII